MKKILIYLVFLTALLAILGSCATKMDTNRIKEIGTLIMVEHFENPDIMYELCTTDAIIHWSWGEQISVRSFIWVLKSEKENSYTQQPFSRFYWVW